jgi:arylsulfatase A-like enzyme/predicted Zn-dependent protease
METFHRAVILVGIALVVVACGGGLDRASLPGDVLIITVDTARADRYSYAGSSPVTTVVADAIAEEGTAFLSAIAPSPITLVSHASLFTGQNPFVHGVRNNGDFALDVEAVTVAEIFADNGWATAAFVGAAVLDSRYGLDQGFVTYDDEITGSDATGMFTYARRPADEVVEAALRWLGETPADRTFVWVHLYDPHAPYDPPEPEKSRYSDSSYNGAIAFADRMVGKLLDGYRRLGRYDEALVVLTSDHGESLNEHQERTHGIFVYEATVRIPLVMRGPGIASGARVTSPVALIDIMPTVIGLAGLRVPETVGGRDLREVVDRESTIDNDRAIYIESLLPQFSFGWSPLRGLRTARWKYIRGAAPELYDLETDPAEVVNLATERADVVEEMATRFAGEVEHDGSPTARTLDVDEAERNRLAALGYISTASPKLSPGEEGDLPDPRERIASLNRMYSAMTRFADGDEDGAISDLEDLVAEEPVNFSAAEALGNLRFRIGDYSGAADAYRRAARLASYNARYSELEGVSLERLGRYEEALQACERALVADPDRTSSRDLRWRLLARLGRKRELVAELERALSQDPANGMARVLLEQVRYGYKPSAELVTALEKAIAELPGDLPVTSALAGAVYGMGDEERAEVLYREVLKERPGDLSATLVVGTRALEKGEIEDARLVIEVGIRKNPDRAAMQVLVARLRIATGKFDDAREALVKAYRLAPGWAETWLTAGELGIAEGLSGQAAANLDRAAAAAGDDRKLWRRLADANRRLGREEEAREAERRSRQN